MIDPQKKFESQTRCVLFIGALTYVSETPHFFALEIN